jgi:hypothetical protein
VSLSAYPKAFPLALASETIPILSFMRLTTCLGFDLPKREDRIYFVPNIRYCDELRLPLSTGLLVDACLSSIGQRRPFHLILLDVAYQPYLATSGLTMVRTWIPLVVVFICTRRDSRLGFQLPPFLPCAASPLIVSLGDVGDAVLRGTRRERIGCSRLTFLFLGFLVRRLNLPRQVFTNLGIG